MLFSYYESTQTESTKKGHLQSPPSQPHPARGPEEKRSEHMQICSTNRMFWLHQEAHVAHFTCADGGEGLESGAPSGTSERSRCQGICVVLPRPRRCLDSPMCCHMRSAPRLGGVQTTRLRSWKACACTLCPVQMLYVHMLYEHGRLCRTLKVMWHSLPSPAGCVENREIYILANSYLLWLWAHKADATHGYRVELR